MAKGFLMVAAVAAGLGAVPAAAMQLEQVSGTVRISDLDLASTRDVARYEQRLRSEARTLCNDTGRVDLGQRILAKECEASVLASGRAKLPQLVAEARARSSARLAMR